MVGHPVRAGTPQLLPIARHSAVRGQSQSHRKRRRPANGPSTEVSVRQQVGRFAADSQRSGNRRVCLLKPQHKAAYDSQLRATLERPTAAATSASPSSPVVSQLAMRPVAVAAVAIPELTASPQVQSRSSTSRSRSGVRKPARANRAGLYSAGIVGLCVAGVAAAYWVASGDQPTPVASTNATPVPHRASSFASDADAAKSSAREVRPEQDSVSHRETSAPPRRMKPLGAFVRTGCFGGSRCR